MVVYAYTPGFGQVIGQIQTNVAFLPKVQQGFYWNPIEEMQDNLSSIGADNSQPYWIDWDLTVVTSRTTKNAPYLQSPVQSTYSAIVAFLSGGAVIEQDYVNFQSQRYKYHGFWNLLPAAPYPSSPESPIAGEVEFINSSFATANIPGDSVLFYPQYSNQNDMSAFIGFRASLGNPGGTYVLSDYPNLFAEIV
jgi:hypothetical protein